MGAGISARPVPRSRYVDGGPFTNFHEPFYIEHAYWYGVLTVEVLTGYETYDKSASVKVNGQEVGKIDPAAQPVQQPDPPAPHLPSRGTGASAPIPLHRDAPPADRPGLLGRLARGRSVVPPALRQLTATVAGIVGAPKLCIRPLTCCFAAS
jgi:hypothetical protein